MLLALSAALCSGAGLRIVGSDLLAPALTPLAAAYTRDNGVTVALDLRGSRPGLAALQAGNADLALIFLPPGEKAPDDASFSVRPIAHRAVLVAVPASQPLAEITFDQLRGIFAAAPPTRVTVWGDLGLEGVWADRPVLPHAVVSSASPTFPLFRAIALLGADHSPSMKWADDGNGLARALEGLPGAIALMAELPKGGGWRALAVASGPNQPAFAPTPENIHRGDYPLAMPLLAVVRRDAGTPLVVLLQFLWGDTASAAFVEAELVPLPAAARRQQAFEAEQLVARR